MILIEIIAKGMRTFCSITVDCNEFEFSGGFTELNTRSYEHILAGNGFRIAEAEKAIQTVYNIRHQKPVGLKGEYHPLAKIKKAKHPFSF
jgi:UDP-N-acetyl-2-amino-2-deoxyglucuronate dehydrogenase